MVWGELRGLGRGDHQTDEEGQSSGLLCPKGMTIPSPPFRMLAVLTGPRGATPGCDCGHSGDRNLPCCHTVCAFFQKRLPQFV